MALGLSNFFDVLGLADEELGDELTITNGLPKKATIMLPDAGKKKKKRQQKKEETRPNAAKMKAKPIVGHDRFMMTETGVIRRPKEKLNFDAMQNQHKVVERRILSLKEYEKELLEKKTVLNAIANKSDDHGDEEKVKDFQWMKVIGQKEKNGVGRFIKPTADKEKAAGQTKVHKVVDVSGFLKPLRSERPFAANANGRGKFTGNFSEQVAAAVAENGGTKQAHDPSTLNIEDHSQFPALK
ncbi:translation initiation factor IF-2-like [Melia azedarach]|uniref:Translation initiation factor IF-2-like n=1 Tax=Melia azedarach TaxID=155640 RepID=A0ACC1YKD0_MELAZ|nr:translation initiation factor IF-2-like [Melia azedarach]